MSVERARHAASIATTESGSNRPEVVHFQCFLPESETTGPEVVHARQVSTARVETRRSVCGKQGPWTGSGALLGVSREISAVFTRAAVTITAAAIQCVHCYLIIVHYCDVELVEILWLVGTHY